MSVGTASGNITEQPDYAGVVAGLRATFDSGITRSADWRDRQLAGIARLLAEQGPALSTALIKDLRRTDIEAGLFDIMPTKGELTHARKRFRSWMRPRRVPTSLATKPGRAWVQYEPVGVVLIIAPWNYPIHLALAPLIAAIAAGNCAVIKPSELTPASSAVLAELLPQYVDPSAVVVVEGGAEASLGLLDQRVDHCFFTGSPAVGSVIMAAAAPHLTPVTLELGGKCPAIVTSSAQLDVTAKRIAFGKLVNSGQTCVAPDYLLVDRTVRDAFVDKLVSTVRRFSEGRPVPIVNSRHAARVAALVRGAGGRVALGGEVDVEAALAQPTIVVDPDPGSEILREEIFGPVLPIVTVDSVDDAIAYVNRGNRPLASYVFIERREDRDKVFAQIVTGGAVVNQVMAHLGVADLPFGGVGTSGMGRYHGHWGFETFSNAKAVLVKPTKLDIPLFYPPYGKFAQRVLRSMS